MRTARPRTTGPLLWAACAALAAGAVLCVIGWYGVSGERFAERQIPYLASSTLPGVALIVSGSVLLAHARDALAAARVQELYELLVATAPAERGVPLGGAEEGLPGAAGPARPRAVSGELLRVPGGTLWHRSDCPLVAGKPEAVPVAAEALANGTLTPCPLCAPDAGREEAAAREDGTRPQEDPAPEGPEPDGPAAGA